MLKNVTTDNTSIITTGIRITVTIAIPVTIKITMISRPIVENATDRQAWTDP
jgi:peptidoglycan biosynthesis protein MviN/MurJ (putative lipid II flippase)